MKTILIALLFGATFLALVPTTSIAAAPSGFSYYKTINIANGNNSYQMFVNISYAVGNDVNCSSHCNANFSDVQFWDIDNTTQLDFWMEKKVNSNYAWTWIELSADVETDNMIMMYYGKVGAAPLSNGTETFLFFDDFSGSTMNATKWYEHGDTPDWTNDGYLYLNNDDHVNTTQQWGPDIRFRERINSTAQDFYILSGCVVTGEDLDAQGGCILFFNSDSDGDLINLSTKTNSGANKVTKEIILDVTNVTLNATYEVTWINKTNVSFYQNDIPLSYHDNVTNILDEPIYCGLSVWDSTSESTSFVWWVFISTYYATEPTVGSVGAEMEPAGSTTPVNSVPNPANAATEQPLDMTTFGITVNDPQGDLMDIYLRTNATGTWTTWKYWNDGTNDSYTWIGSHDPYFTDLTPNTMYFWSVNTTDGSEWDNDTYYFTTNHTYSMTITKTANISNVTVNSTTLDTQLVNYTINVTNTGTGNLTDININETWWNCSCNDWKFWFISTNEPNWETNLTVYTDSCYMSINITNLSVGESYELYILLNVSECANDTVGTLRNYANVTATYATPKSSYCDIQWGEPPAEPVDTSFDVDALAVTIMVFISVFVALACIGLFIRWLGEVMR